MSFIKKMLSCILVFSLTLSLSIPAYAVELNESSSVDYWIEELDDETTEIYFQNENASITVQETDTGRTVIISYEDTGAIESLTFNALTNTMYSTITGEIVKFEDTIIDDPTTSSVMATSTTSVKYISWAGIRSAIGTTCTVVSMVAYLAAKFGVLEAVAIGNVSTIVGFGSLFIPNNSKHGLKVTLKTTKYYRTRLGTRKVYKTTTTVTGVGTY